MSDDHLIQEYLARREPTLCPPAAATGGETAQSRGRVKEAQKQFQRDRDFDAYVNGEA